MSMTKCAECGQPVSTLARACPHCGAPPRPAAAARLVLLATAAAGALAFGTVLATRQGPAEPGSAAIAPLVVAVVVLLALAAAAVLRLRG